MLNPHEPLKSYPVLRTLDLDEARSAVSARYCDHRLNLSRGREVDVRHNHVRGRHVSLNLLSYGADVRIDPGQLSDFYLVQIPLSGAARIQHRAEEIDSSPTCATLLNPDRPAQMEWTQECRKLMLQIDARFLTQVATDLSGAPLPGPVRFDPRVDLSQPSGQALRRLIVTAAEAIEAGKLAVSRSDLSLMHVELELARALLTHQGSNVSHLLRDPGAGLPARQIRMAVEYIHDNFAAELRLEDIAAAAGLHPRSLQLAFQKYLGQSPISYLRNVRLDVSRYHLSRRTNRQSVTEVAFDCGYSHLGRFSRDFRARFGHPPSQL